MKIDNWLTYIVFTTPPKIVALLSILNWKVGILLYLLQEKGIAELEYEISDSGGDVCNRSLSGACVSFIQFDNSEKAQMN